MVWINFPAYASTSIAFWILSIILLLISYKFKNKLFLVSGLVSAVIGLAVLVTFNATLWKALGRPPLRTLGETRLWYSTFIPFIGLVMWLRWKYKWFLGYTLTMAIVFLSINLAHPEVYNKTLMPALQSYWFVPHVMVYIFAYAMLAASALVAFKGIYELSQNKPVSQTLKLADNLVYIGFAFLTLGLTFGALWAKEAWGHYWTWDPKETWAFLTWMMYLIYIHARYNQPKKERNALILLASAIVILLICWFGINYLPSAQNSVHVYSKMS